MCKERYFIKNTWNASSIVNYLGLTLSLCFVRFLRNPCACKGKVTLGYYKYV